MTQHTAGPWRVGITRNKGGPWQGWRETDILAEEGCFLSLHQYHTADEADANARLIAAAPEMLALLRRFADGEQAIAETHVLLAQMVAV